MNKVLYLTLYIFTILATGCHKSEYKGFDDAPSLHFALKDNQIESIKSTFLGSLDKELIVNIPVEIVGSSDIDRTFSLITDVESTAIASTHYEPLKSEYTIKKGQYMVNVPITFKRTMDMNDKVIKLIVRLEPSSQFVNGIPYRQKAILECSNMVTPISIKDWNRSYSNYFGPYSIVKHQCIITQLKEELKGMNVKFEDVKAWKSISMSIKVAYGMKMKNYFANNIINDENGNQIVVW